MQRLRKCALVFSLVAAMTVNAAANRPLVGDVSEQTLLDDYLLTLIIDFFVLQGRLSLPPG